MFEELFLLFLVLFSHLSILDAGVASDYSLGSRGHGLFAVDGLQINKSVWMSESGPAVPGKLQINKAGFLMLAMVEVQSQCRMSSSYAALLGTSYGRLRIIQLCTIFEQLDPTGGCPCYILGY